MVVRVCGTTLIVIAQVWHMEPLTGFNHKTEPVEEGIAQRFCDQLGCRVKLEIIMTNPNLWLVATSIAPPTNRLGGGAVGGSLCTHKNRNWEIQRSSELFEKD